MAADSKTRELLDRAAQEMRRLRLEYAQLDGRLREPIAMVGMACRFPGHSNTPAAFWDMLAAGRDGITELGPRWAALGVQDAGPEAPHWAGLIDQVDHFDAEFFGMSPREAAKLDPQHRLLMETAWEALEHAGMPAEKLVGTRTGVYIGQLYQDYMHMLLQGEQHRDLYTITGNGSAFAAGRLSYMLGLQGPCMTLDTACSSSLVALHLACQSLHLGESQQALVGGVALILSPTVMDLAAQSGALAPDGRCKTFDARGNGYVRGEGCGMVVLKRLSDAQRDGDRVLALIRGSAVNQDGASTGLTTPNALAQVAVLQQALANARVSPADVDCIEAHGTGTSLGDPIEIEALRQVYGQPRSDGRPLLIGSVKTNVGHLEPAAGMAALFKVVLGLQHQVVPPHLNFETLNPMISLDGTPFEIPTEGHPWPRGAVPRLAGISGFALSGTNAHVIVQEAPETEAEAARPALRLVQAPSAPPPMAAAGSTAADAQNTSNAAAHHADAQGTNNAAGSSGAHHEAPELLVLSARSRAGLLAQARQTAAFLEKTPGGDTGGNIATNTALAATAALRRSHHPHRLAVVGDRAGWVDALATAARGEPHAAAVGDTARPEAGKVVFVYPGQGSQWLGMGRELLATEPAFAEALHACDAALRRHTEGWSLLEQLHAPADTSLLARVDVVQPILFAMQVGLTALWRAWGVQPQAVVGHSMGEVAAAHAAGALTLDDAAHVVCLRSRLVRQVSGRGAMLVVDLPPEAAEARVEASRGALAVAAYNGGQALILSGDTDAIAATEQALSAQGTFCRRVNVDYASHSPHMDAISPAIVTGLGALASKTPVLPFYSTVYGEGAAGGPPDAAYWARNLRQPVQFGRTIAALWNHGHRVFVEISPHPVLLNNAEAVLRCLGPTEPQTVCVVPSLRRQQPERASLLLSLGTLHSRGVPVAWRSKYPALTAPEPLPTYAWQRQRHWSAAEPRRHTAARGPHPLLGAEFSVGAVGSMRVWEQSLSSARLPYLADHRIGDGAVVPSTLYIEAMRAAGQQALGAAVQLRHVRLRAMLALPDSDSDNAIAMQVVLSDIDPTLGTARARVCSQQGDRWQVHAEADVDSTGAPEAAEPLVPPGARAMPLMDHDAFYTRLQRTHLRYGPSFQRVEAIWASTDGVWARLRQDPGEGYGLHPTLLDAAFQSGFAQLWRQGGEGADAAWMPDALQSVQILGQAPVIWAHSAVHDTDNPSTRMADLTLCDAQGAPQAVLRGVRLQRLRTATRPDSDALFLQQRWQPLPALPPLTGKGAAGGWLLLGGGELATALQAALKARGGTVMTLAEPQSLAETLRNDLQHLPRLRGVIHAWAIARPGSTPQSELPDPTAAWERLSDSALHVVQAFVRLGGKQPRLWLLTQGAQALGPQAVRDPAAAALWGFGRAVQYEHPELRATLLDLHATMADLDVDALVAELTHENQEDELIVQGRGGGRFGARLLHGMPQMDARVPAKGRPFFLEPGPEGHPVARAWERSAPGDQAVEIEVQTVNTADALPAGPHDIRLVAGRVVAVGRGVEHVRPGDAVVAVAVGPTQEPPLATHLTFPAQQVTARPAHVDPVVAVATAVPTMVAVQALRHAAHVQAGETVLVHEAATPLGQAAIHVALQQGAHVVAVAPPTQHERLAALATPSGPHVHLVDLPHHAEAALAHTDQRGPDVVFCPTGGTLAAHSLTLLADDGRFIDAAPPGTLRSLDAATVDAPVTVHRIDLAHTLRRAPGRVLRLLRDVLADLDQGQLKPLPQHAWAMPKAVRGEASGEPPAGAVAVCLMDAPGASSVPLTVRPTPVRWRQDGTYLITGGLGGLGLKLAEHLLNAGAGHVVLTSRRPPSTPEQAAALAHLQTLGSVQVLCADMGDAASANALLERIRTSLPPLRGVVHAAAATDDGLLMDQTVDKYHRVLAAKGVGAWNLHHLTRNDPIDAFVLYGSAAGFVGAPGVSNYAAANAALGGLASYRRGLGLPALCVHWGAFAGVGLAATQRDTHTDSARGLRSIGVEEGHRLLQTLLATSAAEVAVLPLDGARYAQFFPHLRHSARFSTLLRDAPAPEAQDDARAAIGAASGAAQIALIEQLVQTTLATVLRIGTDKIARDTAFKALGIDSLMGLELRNRLQSSLATALPVSTVIHPGATAASVAPQIQALLGPGAAPAVSAATLHGSAPTQLQAHELRLDRIFPDVLQNLPPQSTAADNARCVLLTGANGFLGRFVLLDLLKRLANTPDGQVVCLLRAPNDDAAIHRLKDAFCGIDKSLESIFAQLAQPQRLQVYAADLARPRLGLAPAVYDDLAKRVDSIVHVGALVNHAFSYAQLFEPNVLGTAELMRLACLHRRKLFNFISSTAWLNDTGRDTPVREDESAETLCPTRSLSSGYIAGYATSKWACEVLLGDLQRRAHVPVNIFRCSLLLPHRQFAGQLNAHDFFTRLLVGLIATGVAPASFHGETPEPFDGVPVDAAACGIANLALQPGHGLRHWHVANGHRDGASVDEVIEWVRRAGHRLTQVAPYPRWYDQFKQALQAQPEALRRASPLPTIYQWEQPLAHLVPLDTQALQQSGADLPAMNEAYVRHCLTQMRALGLIH